MIKMGFHELIEKHFSEIISGFFTLTGAALGWGLTTISKRGKLKLNDVKSEILESSPTTLEFLVDLWIYNSADNIKSINDLTIEILSHGQKYYVSWGDVNNIDIRHYNFSPKQITKISSKSSAHFQQTIFRGDIHRITFIYREKMSRRHFTVYENNLETYLFDSFWIKLKNYSRIPF
jgi:hypothetical protein